MSVDSGEQAPSGVTTPAPAERSADLELMAAFARPKTSEVLRQQLQQLYRDSAPVLFAAQGLALVAVVMFWKRLNLAVLLGWLGAHILLTLGQCLLRYRYARISVQAHSLITWQALHILGSGMLGLLWGGAAAWFPANALEILAFTATLSGLLMFALTQFGAGFASARILILAALTPPFLELIQQDTPLPLLAPLPLVAAALLISSWNESRRARDHLVNAMEHSALITYLDNARQMAEQLNQQLGNEVAQRQEAEQQLQQNQRHLEQRIRERTRELSETNDLLGQQMKLRKSISDALVKSQTRLSQAIEASNLALWDWDLVTGQVYQSQFYEVFGPREMRVDDFVENMRQHIHPDDYLRTHQEMVAYLRGQRERYIVQYRVRNADGRWLWVEDCGKAVKVDKSQRVARMLGTRRDITAEKVRDEQLRMAKSVFDNTSEGVFVLDPDERFVSINSAFTRIMGYRADEVLGRTIVAVSNTPRKIEVFQQARQALQNQGYWHAELYEKRKNGEYFPQWVQINAIRNDSGDITHFAGLMSDLTERKVADEKLQYLLNYDDLTGLANRVLFRDRLHNALIRVRAGETSYALLSLNIDRFKQINESLGHDSGDAVLKQTAQRLTGALPTADTIARLGADEFAVLIESDSRSTIASISDQLISKLTQPLFINGREILTSVSVGITLLPDNARELQPALQQVNMAVRQAKYLGGNTYEFYSQSLRTLSRQRLDLETELRKALQANAIEVYYQPKLHLASGRIESVEALARWRHPERGLIPPTDFVPIAEESGLIAEIGERVLHIACRQAQQWNQDGLGRIKMAVNLSAYQMRQSNLALSIRNVLRETGLDPRQLDLELTESALMENMSRALSLIGKLRALGINVTIDDFGTGYSSLSYLKRFPVDAIKIDQIFVKDMIDNPQDAAITKAMLVLGQSLKLEVVAEGVETKEHLEFLEMHGCDVVQGFYVATPLTAEQATEMLVRQVAQKHWTPPREITSH